MRATSLTICLVLGMLSLACKKSVVSKFADCDQGSEVQWTGKDICDQEADPNHYYNPAVKISVDNTKCKGIHITHTKDIRLDLLLRTENATKSCPLHPFKNQFPVDSGPRHVRDFRTDVVSDPNAVGCGYEVRLTELDNPGKCDPHIDLTP